MFAQHQQNKKAIRFFFQGNVFTNEPSYHPDFSKFHCTSRFDGKLNKGLKVFTRMSRSRRDLTNDFRRYFSAKKLILIKVQTPNTSCWGRPSYHPSVNWNSSSQVLCKTSFNVFKFIQLLLCIQKEKKSLFFEVVLLKILHLIDFFSKPSFFFLAIFIVLCFFSQFLSVILSIMRQLGKGSLVINCPMNIFTIYFG